MKNIWVHSIVIIFLAGILIAVTKILTSPIAIILSELFPDSEAALRTLTPPAVALALLAPGLFSGWFVRRHPLLVGAAAGALAASAMLVAVAALAGRALRYRFKPGVGETSRTAKLPLNKYRYEAKP